VREQQNNEVDANVVLIEDKASGTQLIQELIHDGCHGVTLEALLPLIAGNSPSLNDRRSTGPWPSAASSLSPPDRTKSGVDVRWCAAMLLIFSLGLRLPLYLRGLVEITGWVGGEVVDK
jgi:hypothetical protein